MFKRHNGDDYLQIKIPADERGFDLMSGAILEFRKQVHEFLSPASRNTNRNVVVHYYIAAFATNEFFYAIKIDQKRIVYSKKIRAT